MTRGAAAGAIGRELYRRVEAYAALGDHRTGSDVDRATRAWLRTELSSLGGIVEEPIVPFERYHAEVELTLDGEAVETLPVYYSGTGEIDTSSPRIAPLEMRFGVSPVDLDGALRAAAGAAAAILATEGPDGGLVAVNSDVTSDLGTPTVLVAGRDLGRLRSGDVRLRLRAWTAADESANVVARFGPAGDDPYVVTTPLTGWFRCAGERGTGLAIAIEIARELSVEHPVLFVGATGHEIGHLGAQAFRRAHPGLRPRAVLHLGASVAAANRDSSGALAFSPLRIAMLAGASRSGEIGTLLGSADVRTIPPPEVWPGEGEEWRAAGAPLLSLTGGFTWFHTPADVPENATTPGLLAVACQAVAHAARLLPERA